MTVFLTHCQKIWPVWLRGFVKFINPGRFPKSSTAVESFMRMKCHFAGHDSCCQPTVCFYMFTPRAPRGKTLLDCTNAKSFAPFLNELLPLFSMKSPRREARHRHRVDVQPPTVDRLNILTVLEPESAGFSECQCVDRAQCQWTQPWQNRRCSERKYLATSNGVFKTTAWNQSQESRLCFYWTPPLPLRFRIH